MMAAFDQRGKAHKGIAPLEKQGHAFDVPLREHNVQERREEVYGLASEKIHRRHRLEKYDRRRGHAPPNDGVGHPFEQRDVLV